ncbi:MAG: Asp23/Gls24 family envelope stress response protein [Bilifractor sp.]
MAQKGSKEKQNTYMIYDDHTIGTVQIADEVIATIAALAATEIEGVACLGGGITHAKASRAGARALSKGVRIELQEKIIRVQIIIIMRFGYNIPDTTRKVQEKIKSTLETMTGFEVADVDVSVADVQVDK